MPELLIEVLMGIGILIAITGAIHQWISIFKFSQNWAWACLIIPFIGIIFLLKHYHVVKKGFYISISGLSILILGMFIQACFK